MTRRTWTAIVPVKGFHNAKSRLALADAPSDALARAFLQDTLAALRSTAAITDILVATHDSRVVDIAQSSGAVIVDDSRHPGINAAAAHAVGQRPADTGAVVVVSDLPCLTAPAVTAVLEAAEEWPTAFLPDLEGTGTTMWLSANGAGLPSRFGIGSRAAHRTAGAVDLADSHPELMGIFEPARRDVDTHQALIAAATTAGPHTRAVLDALSNDAESTPGQA